MVPPLGAMGLTPGGPPTPIPAKPLGPNKNKQTLSTSLKGSQGKRSIYPLKGATVQMNSTLPFNPHLRLESRAMMDRKQSLNETLFLFTKSLTCMSH